jgi:pantetheine-phosphate adenylyltransferase
MFTLEERTEMAVKSLKSLSNVVVRSFQGLLVDYAYEQNISTIVKGVRNSADFDYENALHQVGESQKLGIDTYILFARPELAHISSSAVKAIQKEHGFIHEYVPLYVKQNLEKKMSGQFFLGVTGEIGMGKSYVSDRIVALGKNMGLDVFNIDLDRLGHQILENLKEPIYKKVRKQLCDRFGKNIRLSNGMINRKLLGQMVFGSSEGLHDLNALMKNPMLVRLKREFNDKKGLLLINGALLAEGNMLDFCNNNVAIITCDKNVQKQRLAKRHLNKRQIEHRIKSQYSTQQKIKIIDDAIEEKDHGKLWTINNSIIADDRKILAICRYVKSYLGIK